MITLLTALGVGVLVVLVCEGRDRLVRRRPETLADTLRRIDASLR